MLAIVIPEWAVFVIVGLISPAELFLSDAGQSLRGPDDISRPRYLPGILLDTILTVWSLVLWQAIWRRKPQSIRDVAMGYRQWWRRREEN